MNNASLELGGTNWAEKDGSLLGYTVSDDSGRFFPQEFTFARGSNLAATRIGKTGLIEKGRENLVLQSNQFDTTWVTPDATITSGQADKDGGNNAWLLTATSAFNRVTQSVSQSGIKRFSVYAKANTNDYLLLGSVEGAHFYATFNLATGAVDSNNINAMLPSIENVGNGWYRCSATWVGTTTEVRIASQATSGQGGWASTTSGSIYIQDAQLEQGLAASPYIPTTTTTAQAGVLENTPRLNYTTGVANPYLLLEESGTNLVTESEYYNGSYWNKTSISVTNNATTSPEGLQNASKLIPDNGTGGNRSAGRSFVGLSGIHTFSTFAKAGEYGYVSLRLRNNPSAFVMFNLNNGSIHYENDNAQYVTGSAKIEDYGNGWYRCSASFDPSGSVAAGQLFLSFSVGITGDESNQWNGDGVSGIYIWGSQFEEGSYPTSYIPTYSVSATRASENIVYDELQSKGIISSTQGTILFDVKEFFGTAVQWHIQNQSSLDYALRVQFREDGFIVFEKIPAGQTTVRSVTGLTVSRYKIAMSWNGTSLITSFNGTSYINTIDASIASQLNRIQRPNVGNVSVPTNQILVFPTQLNESELNTLTTV
jgi:hypothetical protein